MRRFFQFGAALAVVAVFAFLVTSEQASPPSASAGNNEAHWGDWNCSGGTGAASVTSDVVTNVDDFFLLMEYIAGFAPSEDVPEGCPTLGDVVELAEFLTAIWGDIDCDGDVDVDDAMIILLYSAGILPEDFINCPSIDQVIFFVQGFADFKYQTIQASFATADAGEVEPEFFSTFTLMAVASLIHNNGPNNAAAAEAFWVIEQLSGGSMFYRLLANPGDTCLDASDSVVPCGEGQPTTGPNDSCDDDVDNDDDDLVDFDDPDCVQVLKLRANVSLNSSASLNLLRYLNVRCLTAGTPVFKITGDLAVDSGIADPNLANNSEFFTQSGPTCVISKPGGGSARPLGPPAPWEVPDPYFPVAFPAGGGRP